MLYYVVFVVPSSSSIFPMPCSASASIFHAPHVHRISKRRRNLSFPGDDFAVAMLGNVAKSCEGLPITWKCCEMPRLVSCWQRPVSPVPHSGETYGTQIFSQLCAAFYCSAALPLPLPKVSHSSSDSSGRRLWLHFRNVQLRKVRQRMMHASDRNETKCTLWHWGAYWWWCDCRSESPQYYSFAQLQAQKMLPQFVSMYGAFASMKNRRSIQHDSNILK